MWRGVLTANHLRKRIRNLISKKRKLEIFRHRSDKCINRKNRRRKRQEQYDKIFNASKEFITYKATTSWWKTFSKEHEETQWKVRLDDNQVSVLFVYIWTQQATTSFFFLTDAHFPLSFRERRRRNQERENTETSETEPGHSPAPITTFIINLRVTRLISHILLFYFNISVRE